LNYLKPYDWFLSSLFIFSYVKNLDKKGSIHRVGMQGPSPCLFKFIANDFFKRKPFLFVKVKRKTLFFLHNNLLLTQYMFFTELCVVGTATRRLEGEGFEKSLIEKKR
jgi:hypothetical protein